MNSGVIDDSKLDEVLDDLIRGASNGEQTYTGNINNQLGGTINAVSTALLVTSAEYAASLSANSLNAVAS